MVKAVRGWENPHSGLLATLIWESHLGNLPGKLKTVTILNQAYFPGGTNKTKNYVLSENPQALLLPGRLGFKMYVFMFSNICYTFSKSFGLDLLRLEKVPKYVSSIVEKIYMFDKTI